MRLWQELCLKGFIRGIPRWDPKSRKALFRQIQQYCWWKKWIGLSTNLISGLGNFNLVRSFDSGEANVVLLKKQRETSMIFAQAPRKPPFQAEVSPYKNLYYKTTSESRNNQSQYIYIYIYMSTHQKAIPSINILAWKWPPSVVLNDRRIQTVEIQKHHKVVVQASLQRKNISDTKITQWPTRFWTHPIFQCKGAKFTESTQNYSQFLPQVHGFWVVFGVKVKCLKLSMNDSFGPGDQSKTLHNANKIVLPMASTAEFSCTVAISQNFHPKKIARFSLPPYVQQRWLLEIQKGS